LAELCGGRYLLRLTIDHWTAGPFTGFGGRHRGVLGVDGGFSGGAALGFRLPAPFDSPHRCRSGFA
jgi:hypothetical protein